MGGTRGNGRALNAGAVEAMTQCPRCSAEPGEPCYDLTTNHRREKAVPHVERFGPQPKNPLRALEPFTISPAYLREIADSRRKIHVDARAALILAALAIERLQAEVSAGSGSATTGEDGG